MTDTVDTTAQEQTPATPPNQKLADADKLALDLAKTRKQTAASEVETAKARLEGAAAKQETAELNYRYLVLQLYYKYQLTPNDALTEDGQIVINGATPPQGQ